MGLGIGIARLGRLGIWTLAAGLLLAASLHAQENPLGNVHTETPAPKPPAPVAPATPPEAEQAIPKELRTQTLRVGVNLVLVPVTVTDPLNGS